MYLLASEATLELFKGFLGDNDIETEASPTLTTEIHPFTISVLEPKNAESVSLSYIKKEIQL